LVGQGPTLIWIDLSNFVTDFYPLLFLINGFSSGHERRLGDGGSL
jgi:hypothetical protein